MLDGTQAHVLTVIEHATRRIRILGITLHPTGEWMARGEHHLARSPRAGPQIPGGAEIIGIAFTALAGDPDRAPRSQRIHLASNIADQGGSFS